MAPATSSKLTRFLQATSLVYGPFADLNPTSAASWSPPTNPGAGGHRGRYLWTDAFGLINLVTLHRETRDPSYLILARRLAGTVHDTLGRARGDDDGGGGGQVGQVASPPRLPGATDAKPLGGGLRIGKERADEDGQYHHYLTLWMFALDRLAVAVGGAEGERYCRLALQLAEVVHPRFVLRAGGEGGGDGEGKGKVGGPLRMVWKVSTDMRTVLVPSEGHLDAATGFVVYRLLQRTAVERFGLRGAEGGGLSAPPPLASEIEDYQQLMRREGRLTVSKDPLDLGMGLWMCHFFYSSEEWATRLGSDSLRRARTMLGPRGVMALDASHRLAFREFGSCMGVQCYDSDDEELAREVQGVVDFWEKYLEESTDEDLRPISLVMYAAALIPGAFRDGYLDQE